MLAMIAALAFPSTCGCCGRSGPSPCPSCVSELVVAGDVAVPPGIDRLHALVSYEGLGRDLVTSLKYDNNRAAMGRLGIALASLVEVAELDAVTWPPTVPQHRRQRGFDQAELLGRAVARVADLPCRRLLRRERGPAQTGRTSAERRHGPAFVALGPAPPRVLVVDDVCTTGATLAAAGRALRGAGAVVVDAAVLAQTPLKVTGSSAEISGEGIS